MQTINKGQIARGVRFDIAKRLTRSVAVPPDADLPLPAQLEVGEAPLVMRSPPTAGCPSASLGGHV
jgi:hypothetical protein